jgi:hypothetical protein
VENQHDDLKQTEGAQEVHSETLAREEAPEIKKAGSSRGKVLLGVVIGAVVILGGIMVLQRSSSVGHKASADITLVTSDRAEVECVASNDFKGMHCGYSSETKAWPGDEKTMLRPYLTLDRHLYLVPGLFLEPAILNRFQSELPNKPREQLKRFTAHCTITVIGKVAGVRTRFFANSDWSNPEEVEVGTVSDCKIDG